jgi:hypothetical protein
MPELPKAAGGQCGKIREKYLSIYLYIHIPFPPCPAKLEVGGGGGRYGYIDRTIDIGGGGPLCMGYGGRCPGALNEVPGKRRGGALTVRKCRGGGPGAPASWPGSHHKTQHPKFPKSANVGKSYFGVAHFVWAKSRAQTTHIVKPFPSSKKWPPKRLHDWHPPKRGRRVYVEVRFASPLTLPCLVDLLFGSGHPVYPLRRLHPSRTLGLSPTVGPAAARPVPQPRPSRTNGDRGVLRGAYRDPRGERW